MYLLVDTYVLVRRRRCGIETDSIIAENSERGEGVVKKKVSMYFLLGNTFVYSDVLTVQLF